MILYLIILNSEFISHNCELKSCYYFFFLGRNKLPLCSSVEQNSSKTGSGRLNYCWCEWDSEEIKQRGVLQHFHCGQIRERPLFDRVFFSGPSASHRSLMCFQSALSCVCGAPTQTCTPLSLTIPNTKELSSEELHLALLSQDGFMAIAQAYSLSIFDRDAYPITMGTVCYKPHIAAFDQIFSHQKRPLPTQLPHSKEVCIFHSGCAQDRSFFLLLFFFYVVLSRWSCYTNISWLKKKRQIKTKTNKTYIHIGSLVLNLKTWATWHKCLSTFVQTFIFISIQYDVMRNETLYFITRQRDEKPGWRRSKAVSIMAQKKLELIQYSNKKLLYNE